MTGLAALPTLPERPDARARLRVAYVMSRFPRLSETFVLGEILAVAARGAVVDVYPLLRGRQAVAHPEAVRLARGARYLPFLSRAVLASQAHWLRRNPRAYLGALATLVRATLGSANFLAGGLAIFPKAAHAARLMEADAVDHVHCHFANHPAVAGFVITRLTGIPFSFTAHGSDLHVDRHMLGEKVEAAAFVATVSSFNRDVILRECGAAAAGKVAVVHCGVDTELFAPSERPGDAGTLTVACVGTLHEVKGQAHLVEACRLLAAGGVDVRCVLVGDGPDRAGLERQAVRAGVRDRIVFAGALPRHEVVRVLAEVDAVAAPSVPTRGGKREGIPVALMEAMSCGLPVVASRLSGIPELVHDDETGLLVPPGDPGALAAALRRLAAEPALRRRLGGAARARVLSDFDERGTATALVERFAAGRAA